jgi:hypothetical protein
MPMNNTYSVHLTVHRLNFLNGCSRKQSGDRRYGIAKCDTFPITKRKKPIPNNKGFAESFGVKFGETLVKMRVKTWVKILQLLKERPDLSLAELAMTFGKSLSAMERRSAKLVKKRDQWPALKQALSEWPPKKVVYRPLSG